MSVGLDLWSLQTSFDGQGFLQEVESSAHLADASVVAGHVIKSHGHAKLVGLAELLWLLQQVQSTINILFFQVIDSEYIANLT